MGLFDWFRGRKQSKEKPALSPELAKALETPPRLMGSTEELRGVVVLSKETSPEELREWCEENVPPDSLEVDEALSLFVLRAPGSVREAADHFGYVSPSRALEMADSDDPVDIVFGMMAAHAYGSVGLGQRLLKLKRHADETVKDTATRIHREQQEAYFLAERARKR